MTIRWIYPNFDFEYELARSTGYQPSQFFVDFATRWGSALRLLPGCSEARVLPLDVLEKDTVDCVCGARPHTPQGVAAPLTPYGRGDERFSNPPLRRLDLHEGGFFEGLHRPCPEHGRDALSVAQEGDQFLAWGRTPRVLRLESMFSESLEREKKPDIGVVTTVNGKCFSQQIAERLGIALPQSQIIRTIEAMEAAVRACSFEWVLKHPFGVSGRERVLGKAHELKENARIWASRLLVAGTPLVFEPWIEKTREYSLHFEIAADGTGRFLGTCLLLTAQSGQHRGNRRVYGWEPPASALSDAWRTIHAVAAEGYCGPVSFDAMTGSLGDLAIERALVEINARYTFGRLTLEIGAHLPEGWSYTWWIPSQREVKKTDGRMFPMLSTEIVEAGAYRLPEIYDPMHASKGLVLVAPSEGELVRLELGWMG
ncbi:hypothetical protein L6R29_16235 [Myxococcota bacterium]|nr:hypothetical protein [Myxococcota bacterium]